MVDLKYTTVTEDALAADYEAWNNEVCFVPRTKEKDGKIVYLQSIHSFSKILKSNGLDCKFEKGEHVAYLNQHSVDVFLPTIAFFIDFYLNNKDVIDIIIQSIKDYVSAISTKSDESSSVRFDIDFIDDKRKQKTKIHYDGPVESVGEIKKVIKEIKK